MIYEIPILRRESLDGNVEMFKPCANMENAKMHADNDANTALQWNKPHGRFNDYVATTDVARYRITVEQIGQTTPSSRR
jgi:hypothetical protein